MKIILILLCLFLSVDCTASKTKAYTELSVLTEDEEEKGVINHKFSSEAPREIILPEITYEKLKEQGLLIKQWGNFIDEYNHEWHLHWALENRGDIEETFPSKNHTYKIVLNDNSGMKNNELFDSKFATYVLNPVGEDGERVETLSLYVFFLSIPQFCKIYHR